MTFILALGNREQFIQISDRRLSWNGIPKDEEFNKAGVLLCKDARHIFGFAGLAEAKGFGTRRWLLNSLFDCSAPDYQVNKIMNRLKVKATKDFNSLPSLKNLAPERKRLSIMFSGYNHYESPPMAVSGILTNYQDFVSGRDSKAAWDHFTMNYWSEMRPLDHEFTIIQWIGNWRAASHDDAAPLRKLLQDLKPSDVIVDAAVSLVRRIASRSTAAGTIGKQLSIVQLHRDAAKGASAWYSSTVVGTNFYVPDEVVCLSDSQRRAISDRTFWVESKTGPEISVVPKGRKNKPCPCGSRKRYRECHGRRRQPLYVNLEDIQPTRPDHESKSIRVTALVREAKPHDLTNEQLFASVRKNWSLFAPFAYAEFLEKGRGLILMDLNATEMANDKPFIGLQYVIERKEEWDIGDWPKDLIESYNPEEMIILMVSRRGKLTTIFFKLDDPLYSPKKLHELSQGAEKSLVLVPL